jgi:hypothetical protein
VTAAETRCNKGNRRRQGRGGPISRRAVGEALEIEALVRGYSTHVPRIAILKRTRELSYQPDLDRLEAVIRELQAFGVIEVTEVGVRYTHAGRTWQRSGWVTSALPRRGRVR